MSICSRRMSKLNDSRKDSLSVAIGLGLCCLPFIFFATAFFFDVRAAWFAVVIVFVVILVVCNALCRFRLHDSQREHDASKRPVKTS
jgi:Na+/melibiose symporter-like transporter